MGDSLTHPGSIDTGMCDPITTTMRMTRLLDAVTERGEIGAAEYRIYSPSAYLPLTGHASERAWIAQHRARLGFVDVVVEFRGNLLLSSELMVSNTVHLPICVISAILGKGVPAKPNQNAYVASKAIENHYVLRDSMEEG